MFDAVSPVSLRLSQPPVCSSGGAWVGPDVGSTVAWQDTADHRAPLVASVLEQFGRMTALAKETTSNLLTSTAYWGAQPGQHHLTFLHHAVHHPLWQVWMPLFRMTSNPVMPAFCILHQFSRAWTLYWQLIGVCKVTWCLCIRLQHCFMCQPMLPHRQPEHTHTTCCCDPSGSSEKAHQPSAALKNSDTASLYLLIDSISRALQVFIYAAVFHLWMVCTSIALCHR